MTLLKVDSLRVRFKTEDGYVEPLDGVSFEIDRGQVVGHYGIASFCPWRSHRRPDDFHG